MKKSIAIIGGGTCALMLACELDPEKFIVTIYESNAALGRKFLVAGDGGLNITHSESETSLIKRYSPSGFIAPAIKHFSNQHLIQWFNNSGIQTFIGSSGRVFPKKGIKPVEVLNTFLEKIKRNNVGILVKHIWKGFSQNGGLIFESKNGLTEATSDYTVFCLGGASWPVTGSKGDWLNYFVQKKIQVHPFLASNCAFKINWPADFISKAEGKVLKNVSINCDDHTHFGEVVITKFGIEGSGIYPLSPQIRKQLEKKGIAEIEMDLKTGVSEEKLIQKLKTISGKKGFTENLKSRLNLNPLQIQLLKTFVTREDFLDPVKLAKHIKNFKLVITGTAPLEEAISIVGGIDLNEIDQNFQIKKLPNQFAIGEMLNYDAPTGGYLIQSCFSMAKWLAGYLNTQSGN